MGRVKESNNLEDLLLPPSVFPSDAATSKIESEEKLRQYEEEYERYAQNRNRSVDSSTSSSQRAIIDAFQKAAQAAKKCDSCGSFSPPLRKDGYSKLFEKPLQKRLRKSMQGMKIKLKVSINAQSILYLTC
jgi:hypothetical protein